MIPPDTPGGGSGQRRAARSLLCPGPRDHAGRRRSRAAPSASGSAKEKDDVTTRYGSDSQCREFVPFAGTEGTVPRPAIVRLTLAVPLTLAVLLSVPTQRVGAGVSGARVGSGSSLGTGAPLHRMSN